MPWDLMGYVRRGDYWVKSNPSLPASWPERVKWRDPKELLVEQHQRMAAIRSSFPGAEQLRI